MFRKIDTETKLGGFFGIIALVVIIIEISIAGWSLDSVVAGVKDFAGVMIGKRYLQKVTMTSIQTLVGLLLFGVGLALVTGIL